MRCIKKWTKLLTFEITFFGFKRMKKICLEKNILNFNEPLQRYLQTSQAISALLGSSNFKGAPGISKKKCPDHFLSQKWYFQDLRVYSTYLMSSTCYALD
jgi:hypothetical protein